MGLSKTNRILILLVIDSAFFLLELIAGYSVHSLALVADSFHMLNDVISLLVGLWAVKVANRGTSSKMYTYGWQRAETLGALVNGVFLVALCLSIFLEAIQRLVEPQEVKNPKLVCGVGCAGLVSNILGLVLFHDHSHGHGHSHGHSHGDEEDVDAAEQGHSHDHGHSHAERGASQITEPTAAYSRRRTLDSQHRSSRRGFGDIGGHPASMRQDIIIAANRNQFPDDDESFDSDDRAEDSGDNFGPTERSTLLGHKDRAANYTAEHAHVRDLAKNDPHKSHNHAQPKPKDKNHGHDLNMRGVFLHVMGDALGNIGVIASALVIWLTDYSWRFYVDPGISLVITVIILASAIPLCKAASRILLQAVPHGLSIDHIKEDIESLPGVIGAHHLHVWQLSDTKTVASVHIQVDTEIKGEGSERYMDLAKQVSQCLHAYGIRSSTIQPEFPRDSDTEDNQPGSAHSHSAIPSRTPSVRDADPQACLMECGVECGGGHCCPTKPT
ncbi:cation diffusion facilitator family transporter [Aspergillus mulundensis]|uniref:CDF divalent metal cation transporter n=1 Tax=Aspergillus mulundensis TaxID=1810919 RepID=A0A3D8S5D9_9EURO|nr:CDF divalent metal cation transporter [Aspergillus mulundensis]RDW81499.1 CDF divalent metal cation transporter [Aspergillus mulundensis]